MKQARRDKRDKGGRFIYFHNVPQSDAKINKSVPFIFEALTALPGVGRKTANVVLGNAFGKNALAVDTHVKRVSMRLGLTKNDDPDEIEKDLAAVIPERLWTKAGLLFILHGRNICKAKNPGCASCPVREFCDFYGAHQR